MVNLNDVLLGIEFAELCAGWLVDQIRSSAGESKIDRLQNATVAFFEDNPEQFFTCYDLTVKNRVKGASNKSKVMAEILESLALGGTINTFEKVKTEKLPRYYAHGEFPKTQRGLSYKYNKNR
jgi:hypothetical protein